MRSLRTLVVVMTAVVTTVLAVDSPGRQGAARSLAVPPPVQVTSGVVTVLGDSREGRMIEVGADGIPIIHGVRSPDDPEGTPIYRNARIINNKLWTAEDEARANQVEGRTLPAAPRQARVLNQRAAQDEGRATHLRYPHFYYQRYYNNERSGVVAEDSFEDDNISTSSEQVVSYSYLAAPQGHAKDVVYGSGAAAKPPTASHASPAPVSSLPPSPPPTASVASASAFEPSKLLPSASHSFPSSVSSSPSPSSSSPVSHAPSAPHGHSESSFVIHQAPSPSLVPHTVHEADPSQFIIKDSTFQPFPGAPTFTVPLPVPHNQITSHTKQAQTGSEVMSSYVAYQGMQPETHESPIYHRMMEPLRKMGQRIFKAASPMLQPMMEVGHRLSERLQLNKRVSAISENLKLDNMNNYLRQTVDSDTLPVVAGVGAITAIGLAVLAVAAASNSSTIIGKRSIEDSALNFLDQQLVDGPPVGESGLGHMPTSSLLDQSPSPWCSKRVLCDAMTYLPDHYLFAFEKRLGIFLDLLNSGSAEEPLLKQTATDFVEAVRLRQCDKYTCGGEQVDSSQILTDTSGPR